MVAPPAGTGAAGLLTYWTATSTVSSSLSLFWDNPNIRLGIGTSQPSSTLHIIAGTTSATTLQLMGLPNQTGNLLSIGSSSGQRWFTLSSLGVASSSEFRANSSTIGSLVDFQGTKYATTTNWTLSSGVDSQVLFGQLGGGATSSLAMTFTTSTSQLLFSGSSISFAPNATSTSFVFIQGTQVASTSLHIRGVTNQTANLLTISSSTGINFFTLSALGLASSTEFRANSSTIAALYDFNGNKYATSSAFTAGVDTQLLFGQVGGGATSSVTLTLATSTSQLLFSGSHVSIAPNTTSTSLVFIQGTQTGSTTLNIQGVTSQTASLLTISSSTGIPLFNINAIGQIAIATSTYPASSTLLTIASSSQIFNISSGGNVMIGTSTAPNAALLTIATTSNIMTVLSNGLVGIGTAGPQAKFDVAGSNIASSSDGVQVMNLWSTDAQAIDKGAGISFGGYRDDAASQFRVWGSVQGRKENGTTANNAGYLSFFTHSPSTGKGERMRIDSSGNVGIGTTGPNAKLHVNGTGSLIYVYNGANAVMQVIDGGTSGGWNAASAVLLVSKDSGTNRSISAAGTVNTSGNDYAEYFYQEHPGTLERGDLTCVAAAVGNVTKCDGGGPVLGVVSTNPGYVGNDIYDESNPDGTALVGLTGQVPTKVSLENGPIEPGDRLTVSPTIPGAAMKMTAPGQTIGIALENSYNKDKILTFVNISYWIPTLSSSSFTDAEGASSSSVASSSSSPLDNLMGYIIKKFQDFFDIVFEKGLLKVAHLITDLIETKNLTVKNGVTVSDKTTGEQYCISIDKGDWYKAKGSCESTSATSTSID